MSETFAELLPFCISNNVQSSKSIVNAGQSRINKINGVQSNSVGPQSDASSGSVTNEDVTYVAPVSIGGNTWNLIVDTGCMLFLSITSKWLLTSSSIKHLVWRIIVLREDVHWTVHWRQRPGQLRKWLFLWHRVHR